MSAVAGSFCKVTSARQLRPKLVIDTDTQRTMVDLAWVAAIISGSFAGIISSLEKKKRNNKSTKILYSMLQVR